MNTSGGGGRSRQVAPERPVDDPPFYGCNRSEQRLVQALLDGNGLRQAADSAGVRYATARWYLKGLFQKTGTSRHGELIARVLRDANAATLCLPDPLWDN